MSPLRAIVFIPTILQNYCDMVKYCSFLADVTTSATTIRFVLTFVRAGLCLYGIG